ncbi:polysaccharide pyruvyl transferase family protein [Pseudothermotoga sp. U03pept]|uniref:polysaccharide pyruvyl transferase family protein n=1 Tax=Pseudothermotoga sp. U03pept TaxID=3447012 RepID=UPI003F0E8B39
MTGGLNVKISLITLLGRRYNDNYGAVLQCLALQEFLRKHGYDIQVLDFDPTRIQSQSPFLVRVLKFLKKEHVFRRSLAYLKQFYHSRLFSNQNRQRSEVFNQFRNEYIRFTDQSCHSFEQVFRDWQSLHKRYELFLVGSDQVWNSRFHNTNSLKVYLLNFVNYGVKISYASSVAANIPDELVSLYRNSLSSFFRISVREEGSAVELSKILGSKPTVVLDPTFLLSAEDWASYAESPAKSVNPQFVFVYDLYRSKNIIPVVERITNRYGIKYVNYDPAILLLRKYKGSNLLLNFYTYGPKEFLWLIKNSKFVVTSSFHGMVFAIIFGKPFYVILWDDKGKIKQNDRVTDVLSKLGLQDRAFTDPKEILRRGLDESIDWEQVYEKLEKLKQESAEWLLNAISEALKERENPRKYENVSTVHDCYGCFACYNVCPHGAVEMVFNEEGFYFPKVDNDLCTKCGLCVQVCPALKFPENENLEKPRTYVAWSLDEPTRLASASGGIYPELAKAIIEKGGTVFAVGWNKEWLPEHMEISTTNDISKTVSSKYLQSYVGKSYEKILKDAKEGRKVLFVGTPCQVAGLKNIIRKTLEPEEMRNVLLIDLVCHGVNSSLLFKKYLGEVFRAEEISEINFRSKDTGWSRFSFKVLKKNGKSVLKPHYKDAFFYGFLKNLYLRRSCYECPFSTLPRQGDLTLGDFWGVPEKYKDEGGVSVVLVNNEKGMDAFQELIKDSRIFAEEVPLEMATKSNPRIYSGYMEVPLEREKILKEYRHKSWRYIEKNYIKPPKGIRGLARRAMSLSKRVVRKLLKR